MKRWFLGVLVLLVTALSACDFLLDGRVPPLTGVNPGNPVYAPKTFVNWETPHVSPLALAQNGSRLCVVNTPAARLEIFEVTDHGLLHDGFVPVGLDPVSVRPRTNEEIWVANHLSDSVSIVDLSTRNVVRTLQVGDEPTDICFALGRAFVVCSQVNRVEVFDVSDLDVPAQAVPLAGEDPRALAVSPDGRTVVAAIFESGNNTTVVPHERVSDPSGPYGGQNPPPNRLTEFAPAMADHSAEPPSSALIVRWDPVRNAWLDESGVNWNAAVTWRLHDHDVAVIHAQTLEVQYVRGLMNLNMHLAVRADGTLTVVGTEATNHRRFEPNLTSKFVRSRIAFAEIGGTAPATVRDLNPHLEDIYASNVKTLPLEERSRAVADPRAIVWSSNGEAGYVAGQGSNNVAWIDTEGVRMGQVAVGAGPSGLALDEISRRLYVLNRFDASVSIIDTGRLVEIDRVTMFDPTPEEITTGRQLLYDARLTSGLGVTACASCHVDGRTDHLAWDLGNPADPVKPFDQDCDLIFPLFIDDVCRDFHPLKGPMVTQTLQGIIGNEPHHWRGDREDLAAFGPAFLSLNGADNQPTAGEMSALERFLATIQFPPNPHRQMDNSLPSELNGDDPKRGRRLYMQELIDRGPANASGILSCNRCHALPTGTNNRNVRGAAMASPQGMKVAQLRNMYEKTGFSKESTTSNRGFGFSHDGSMATLQEFLSHPAFDFGEGEEGKRKRRDVIAFVMCLSTDTHAGVGAQVTLTGAEETDNAIHSTLSQMLELADQGQVGLIVKGRWRGEPRGFAYQGDGVFLTDCLGDTVPASTLRAATRGSELTWTLVPLGSEGRLGIDADLDDILDGDERAAR